MFKFNLLIFIRQLRRYKRFSIASFIGLVVGITSFLIMLLFANELGKYDNWDTAFNQIFELRYNKPFKAIGDQGVMKHQSAMLAPYLKESPDVVAFCKIKEQPNYHVQSQLKSDFEPHILAVDSNFFQIFPFRLLYGNPRTVLDSVRNVVVSRSIALKYFGKANCIGDSLHFANTAVVVTGVLADDNGPTTFHMDIVGRLTVPKWALETGWGNFAYRYFCKLSPNVALSSKQQDALALSISSKWFKIPQVFESQKDFIGLGGDYNTWIQDDSKVRMHFFPIRKLYAEDKGTLFTILIVIGFTILILCCLDYTNRQIGFLDTRNIEMGIKSLNGWTPQRIVGQVLMETVLFVAIAFFCSFIVVELLIPFVNKLLGEKIVLYRSLMDVSFLWKLLVFFLLVVLVAGIYPAFYITSLEPASVLKGDYQGSDRGHKFRLGLLSFQLMLGISVTIIFGAVWLQIHYLRNKDTGFDYRNLYYFSVRENISGKKNYATILDSVLRKYPNIVVHSYTSLMPLVDGDYDFEPMESRRGVVNVLSIDYDSGFFEMIGHSNLLKGRTVLDSNEVVVNETFVKKMGLQEPILGQKVVTIVSPKLGTSDTFRIRGVVKNIMYQTWEFANSPIFYHANNRHNQLFLVFRTSGNDAIDFVQQIEQDLALLFPVSPPQVLSSIKDYEKSFEQIDFLYKVLNFFTVLIIASVLLGFVTYTNFYFQKSKKEMVLRMLMGAKSNDFIASFGKNVWLYFLVAIMLCWGISVYVLKRFFGYFAFTIDYPYWLYILVPLVFMLLVLIVVILTLRQIMKKEPAEVLRYE